MPGGGGDALEARLELQLQLQHGTLELEQPVRVGRAGQVAAAVEEERGHRRRDEDGDIPLLKLDDEVRR